MNPDSPQRSERGFWHLTAVQFQGALNDNLFRVSLMLIAGNILTSSSSQLGRYNGLLTMLFPAAYLAFSVWAGFLADRYSKRTVTLVIKAVEVVLMLLAILSFTRLAHLDKATPSDLFWPTAILFFTFAHSAFYSPSKYGIIPELVADHRLGWANGVIGMTTNLAIVLGASLSTVLVKALKPDRLYIIPIILAGLSVCGLLASIGIDRTAPANPTRPIWTNPFTELKRYFTIILRNRALTLTILGNAYFWGLGSLLLAHVLVWSRDSLGYEETGQGIHFLLLALGIGLGSWIAGSFSRQRIEIGLVPLGAIVMGVFSFPMAFASPHNRVLMGLSLALVGVGGGMFSVPLAAMIQHLSDRRERGGILAADNYITNGAILLFSLFYYVLNLMQVRPNTVFLLVGVITLAGLCVVIRFTPEALMRFVAFLLTNTIYRIRPINIENLPKEGGALILCNHVTYVDALLLGTISPRPIRFLAYADFFNMPLLGRFLKTTRSIPIASQQKPREMIQSLKVASEALVAGEVVCLFPEGQLTRSGQMLPFSRGFELILRDAPGIPIIPVYLDGVWGSIFSFEGQKYFWKRPRQIPYPVRVVFGEPMPGDSTPFAVRQKIEELGADAAIAAKPDRKTLDRHLVANARRHWGSFAMVDTLMPAMNWGRSLTGAIIFARKLAPLWSDAQTIGVLLPPSCAAALVNFAATLSGRAAINLNYTIGQEALNHCARQSGIKTVVTSIKFLEKVNLVAPVQAINLEQHRPAPSLPAKLAALFVARFFPVGALAHYCKAVRRPAIDSLATIIFSSGSTGVPKGVPLSHFNVVSNIESFRQAIQLFPNDRLLGVLPFFHSFGYTVSLWGSATLPFGCVFHNNPLDGKTIGELAEKEKVTLIIATPTFLFMYAKRIPGGQFGGVKLVVSGAERLPDNVSDAFKERFGIEPLQGYGTTECSPVVSVNISDHRSPGIHQLGSKRGSVGRALPGVTVRAIDADSGEPLGANIPGLLHVKGPNVMSGYLDMPEKTAEVLKDGWYNTGDMGTIDEEGFIFITGRLSRFSKIGGEMVPHGAVEDKMHELLGLEERVMAVTGVPDEKKGEQLVVLHTLDDAKRADLLKKLPAAGLPNLYIPRKEMFFKVEALPMLGTGKLDLREVNRLAKELTGTGEKGKSEGEK